MGFIDKIILLYVCMGIAVAFWQPSLVFEHNSAISNLYNIPYNQSTAVAGIPGCSADGIGCFGSNYSSQIQNQSVISSIFNQLGGVTGSFIDSLNNVIGFFQTAFNFLFWPYVLFSNKPMSDAPTSLFYIFAIPMVTLLLIAIVNWVRSGIT